MHTNIPPLLTCPLFMPYQKSNITDERGNKKFSIPIHSIASLKFLFPAVLCYSTMDWASPEHKNAFSLTGEGDLIGWGLGCAVLSGK